MVSHFTCQSVCRFLFKWTSGRFLARICPLHFAAQSRQSKFWLCETSMLIKLNIHESFFKSHHWDPQHAFAFPLNHIRPSTLAAAKPPNPSASFPDGQTAPRGSVPGAMGTAVDLKAGRGDRPHLLWTVTVLTPLQSSAECSSV